MNQSQAFRGFLGAVRAYLGRIRFKMHLPTPFLNFCEALHQDIFALHPSESEMITVALEALTTEDRLAVKQFVAELLTKELSVGELQEFWWNTPAEIYFPDNDIVIF